MNNSNQKKIKKTGLTLLAGMTIGYVASLFMPSEARKKQKKFIEDKAAQLTDILKDQDPIGRIKNIFQKKTEKAKEKYHSIKENVIAKLSSLKGTIKDIDKSKYNQVISEVLIDAKKKLKLKEDEIKRLKKYLKEDYQKIKNSI